jgi:hypothetical protein
MSGVKQPVTIRRKRRENRLKLPRGFLLVDKRKYPRYSIELPLDYALLGGETTDHWGFVTDASEGGLLVYLREKIEIGAILKIELYYAKDLPMKRIKATGEVVWSDLAARESFGEYRYGLQLRSIEKRDLDKLKMLLKEAGNLMDNK